MTSLAIKQDRIGARVPHEVYQLLNRAATLTGATINQFLVQSALKEAHAVIERDEVLRLSAKDWGMVLKLLDAPPKPNVRLKSAIKRYRAAKLPEQNDAHTSFNWKS